MSIINLSLFPNSHSSSFHLNLLDQFSFVILDSDLDWSILGGLISKKKKKIHLTFSSLLDQRSYYSFSTSVFFLSNVFHNWSCRFNCFCFFCFLSRKNVHRSLPPIIRQKFTILSRKNTTNKYINYF